MWRTLIPSKLRPSPQLHLLLLLYQCTAPTPESGTAIPTAGTLNTMPLAHLATSNCLNDPLGIAESEDTEDRALQDKTSRTRTLSARPIP